MNVCVGEAPEQKDRAIILMNGVTTVSCYGERDTMVFQVVEDGLFFGGYEYESAAVKRGA